MAEERDEGGLPHDVRQREWSVILGWVVFAVAEAVAITAFVVWKLTR
jgi:hypothetical protein